MSNPTLTLEQRIAAALTATDIRSSDLSQLLVDVEAAAGAADADATKAREVALDPAVVVDTAKVGAAPWQPPHWRAIACKPRCLVYRSGTTRCDKPKPSQRGQLRP